MALLCASIEGRHEDAEQILASARRIHDSTGYRPVPGLK
jgi:hypothetical protein